MNCIRSTFSKNIIIQLIILYLNQDIYSFIFVKIPNMDLIFDNCEKIVPTLSVGRPKNFTIHDVSIVKLLAVYKPFITSMYTEHLTPIVTSIFAECSNYSRVVECCMSIPRDKMLPLFKLMMNNCDVREFLELYKIATIIVDDK
jgi:hypothetical protein